MHSGNIRITRYAVVPPDQLLANPLNARRHPGRQRDAIRGALSRVGWVAPCIVNERTGNMVDGHMRVEEALSAGDEGVPVLYIDVDPAEEATVLATFDPVAALATYDSEVLGMLREAAAPILTEDATLSRLVASLARPVIDTTATETEDGTPRGLGTPVIAYSLVFDTEEQQQTWYRLIRHLRDLYPDGETIGERLTYWIADHLPQE